MDLLLMWLLGVFAIFSPLGSTTTTEIAPSPAVSPGPAAEPELSYFQDQLNRRDPLPLCGDYVSPSGGLVDRALLPGWTCLEDSVGGAGGEMVASSTTEEGDPVYTYVRVTPQEQMEIYVDATLDRYGSGEFTYESCPIEVASFRQGCP